MDIQVASATNDYGLLKQNGRNNTTIPGTADSTNTTRVVKRRGSCDNTVQTTVGGDPKTLEGSTQANFSAASDADADAVGGQVFGAASSGIDVARQNEVRPIILSNEWNQRD